MRETDSQQPAAIGYLQLIRRNKNFRQLWFGQIVSLLGDWFNLIASATLVAQLTDSGLAVSGLFVVRMLAPFLMSPIAGVVADRYNRKWILILSDLFRAVIVLGFLLVRRPEHVWFLYTLTALQLGLSGFFFPARSAILPDLVSREELGAANALSSATWSVMLALGAALGGLVSGQFGSTVAFIVDALTFVLSAGIIWGIVYERPPALEGVDTSILAGLHQYIDGLRYLVRHVDILFIAMHKLFISGIVSGPLQVIRVIVAEDIFRIGEGGGTSLGLMYAVVGIGTGIGPILARLFTGDRDRRLRVAIFLSYLLSSAALIIAAPLTSFGMVLLGLTLRGVGTGIGWVFSTQLLLQLVPDQVRGRVFGTQFAMFTLANAMGVVVGGRVLDANPANINGIFWWMAGLSLIPAGLWGLWLLRRQNGSDAG